MNMLGCESVSEEQLSRAPQWPTANFEVQVLGGKPSKLASEARANGVAWANGVSWT